jgi:Domain of unknown function (DU1801)
MDFRPPFVSVMKEIDQYFESHEEPVKGCLSALRKMILHHNKNITEVWRYRMPFYQYDGKRFCYLWYDKKRKVPYLGIVNGTAFNDPDLLQENRSRMKVFLIDPNKDIPIKRVNEILKRAVEYIGK